MLAAIFLGAMPVGAEKPTTDTVIVTANGTLHFKVISHEEFFRTPAKPVTDIPLRHMGLEELRTAFDGEYEFIIESNENYEKNFVVKKDGKEHIRLDGYGQFRDYYPDHDILLFMNNGHASDLAVFLSSGKDAFNPYGTIYSWDRKYRLTSFYCGQDSDIHQLWKRNDATDEWEEIANLTSILTTLPPKVWGYGNYIYDAYFYRDTLYYRSVYGTVNEGSTSIWVAIKLF